MDLVSATTSAIIGFVLLLAGIPKLNDHDGVLRSVRGYKVLPVRLEVPIARILPVAETVIGILLVLGVAIAWPPWLLPSCSRRSSRASRSTSCVGDAIWTADVLHSESARFRVSDGSTPFAPEHSR